MKGECSNLKGNKARREGRREFSCASNSARKSGALAMVLGIFEELVLVRLSFSMLIVTCAALSGPSSS